jgi:MATE family multidrug resistance protein
MLAPLGPLPLAAVGLTHAVAVIVFAAAWGMLSAVSVRVGLARGARAGRRVPGLIRNGLVLGLIAGLAGAGAMVAAWPVLPRLGQPRDVLAILPPYWAAMAATMVPFALLTVFKAAFEAVGRPWAAAGFAFLAVLVNVPLNYALIWGFGPLPALGLTGAGLATLVAEALAFLAALAFWGYARSTRRLRLPAPLSAAEVWSAAREGAPLGALYVAETGAMAVTTLMIGTFGAAALAANQVAMSVGGVLYMVPLGIAGAVAIRVAQAQGAGRDGALRPVAFAALALATLWLAGSALLLALGGRAIAEAMVGAGEPEVVALAAAIFTVFALMQVFDGLQSTMLGALRGLSDTAWPALVSMVAYWGVGLPLAWMLAVWAGLGAGWVWVGWLVALAGAGAALVVRFLDRTAAPRLSPCAAGV